MPSLRGVSLFDAVLPVTTAGDAGPLNLLVVFLLGILLLGVLPIDRVILTFLLYLVVWGISVQAVIPAGDIQTAVFVGGLVVNAVAAEFQPYTWSAVLDVAAVLPFVDEQALPGPGPNEAAGEPPQVNQARTPFDVPDAPEPLGDPDPEPDHTAVRQPEHTQDPDHWTPDRMDLTAFEED